MKICIYGAGAIGGFIGARLARAGEEVSLIARGPHLAAMKAKGLKLLSEEGDFTVTPRCAADPAELGPQDYVVLALKAPAVAGIVEQMQPLLGPKTAVVMAVNGVPWWYFHDLDGPWRDRRLKTVDPDDRQWRGIGPGRVLGCVVYPAAEVAEPGVVRHQSGDRFSLGEPDGSKSDRAVALSRAMIAAGLKAPVKPDIRTEIWVKLWGNVAFNPISALTGGTLKRICEDPSTRALARSIMNEAEAVANKLGVKMPIDVERRIEGAAGVGEHKTSMLQDLERGRPTEIDAIVGAVAELGDVVGQDTPYIDAIYALVRQKAALLGVYP
ncbi:2-dehydropantoate 2-reductase [Hypericibacter adhaerens]|uniref:2-dehydropantoate 2-reductase n=1 Tax=Hypericibacter adhaerens TaxID=2602016 RepID=A0A5J6N1N6_9PROT|nr:2-dehydropantoate 2-reductase [Hypericibacter adhaerens]QEX22865.1 2-dehydropantoate 2-reductase [Hypericibacter adhaerens]